MENPKNKKIPKSNVSFDSIRVRPSNKIRFAKYLAGANKKETGSKIVSDDLFGLMLDKITEADISWLQSKSLKNEDRIELLRRIYSKVHGPISKDDFYGFTISDGFGDFLREHGREIVAPLIQRTLQVVIVKQGPKSISIYSFKTFESFEAGLSSL